MSAPIISSTIPLASETDVYINQLLYIQFDQSIDEATLTDNTILLYRTSDYAVLDKTISYDSSLSKVTVIPDVIFDKDTTYQAVVVGIDRSTTCVKNPTGESLVTSASWYFTTGDDTYSAPEDTQSETQPDEEVAGSPTVKVLEPRVTTSFAIIDTDPDNYDSHIGTLNGDDATVTWNGPIAVQFNRLLASGVSIEQDWLTIAAEPADGEDGTTTSVPSGVILNATGNTLYFTIPTYGSNNESWSINNEIIVNVSEDVQDYQGNTLGDNYQFMFSTKYYPYYCTVKKIRSVIGTFIRNINDDAISRNIYLNSLEAYNIANVMYSQNVWTMGSPTFAAKMYVCCKTQYDLLHARLLDMVSDGTGQMKRLGDFTIQDTAKVHDGVKSAMNKALQCAQAWLKQLLGKNRRAAAKMVVKGITSMATPPMRGVRTWAVPGASDSPGSNKRSERSIKSPGLYDEWS